jgi:hypothetical protein
MGPGTMLDLHRARVTEMQPPPELACERVRTLDAMCIGSPIQIVYWSAMLQALIELARFSTQPPGRADVRRLV